MFTKARTDEEVRNQDLSVAIYYIPGSNCSKLTMSLVNISLKFQMYIFEICQYFFLKKI